MNDFLLHYLDCISKFVSIDLDVWLFRFAKR